jgi:hypothetical protein
MGLTDAILTEARNSRDPALAGAAALVRRIERRDTYTFCGEVGWGWGGAGVGLGLAARLSVLPPMLSAACPVFSAPGRGGSCQAWRPKSPPLPPAASPPPLNPHKHTHQAEVPQERALQWPKMTEDEVVSHQDHNSGVMLAAGDIRGAWRMGLGLG